MLKMPVKVRTEDQGWSSSQSSTPEAIEVGTCWHGRDSIPFLRSSPQDRNVAGWMVTRKVGVRMNERVDNADGGA